MKKSRIITFCSAAVSLLATSCFPTASSPNQHIGVANAPGAYQLANYPSVAERSTQIANEVRGDYFIGRRYYVKKTRFWGFIRKSGSPWDSSNLVVMNEKSKRNPDRIAEYSSDTHGRRYGYDQNYEYLIRGYYTGKKIYEPNSNQILPEFVATSYELLNSRPGWLFSPEDKYHPEFITYRYANPR